MTRIAIELTKGLVSCIRTKTKTCHQQNWKSELSFVTCFKTTTKCTLQRLKPKRSRKIYDEFGIEN